MLSAVLGIVLVAHFFIPRKTSGGSIAAFGVIALISVGGFVTIFYEGKVELRYILAFTATFGVMLYVLLCEALLSGGAQYLTRKRGEKWVKEIDYLYLAFAAVGILAAINRMEMVTGRLSKADVFGPLFLATAVVLRFIKTRAEIAGWNKAHFQAQK